MPEINAKFIIAIVVAVLVIGSGFSFFHESYNARPYVDIKDPHIFENEKKMLSFSKKGSSFSFTGNGTFRLYGSVTTASGNLYTGNLSIYVFPRVDQISVVDGKYSVILCHYGAYTVGYKASGYKTTFATFSILSGSEMQKNVQIHGEGVYNVSGNTKNLTLRIVPYVNLIFVSFFGQYQGSSNGQGLFSTHLQNGTYAVLTIKRNYNETPKPLFFNVTGSSVNDLDLVMKPSNNTTFTASGIVNNDLGQPLGGVRIESIDLVNSKIIDTTYSLSNGQYSLNISGVEDYLVYSLDGYNTAHSKILEVKGNIANLEQNLTVVDPFTVKNAANTPTGLSFLPSFMDNGVSSYEESHNSISLYATYSSNGNVSLSMSNSYYAQGPPPSTDLMTNFTVIVVAYLNGTYYHTTSTMNSNGIVDISLKYGGYFHFVVYVPGFNWTTLNITTLNNPDNLIGHISLTPLPGQYFTLHYNVTSKGYSLLYPNITMNENGIIVNQSLEGSSSGYFFYFFDNDVNYEITLNLSVNEVGFENRTISLLMNTNSTHNIIENIVMKPVFSIGYGFNSTSKSIPGFSPARINESMAVTFSSNKYTDGKANLSVSLTNLTSKSNYNYILYTRIYGTTYSKIIAESNLTFEINVNFTAPFHFTLIGFYYTAYNISALDKVNQNITAMMEKRSVKSVTIDLNDAMAKVLNRDYGNEYSVSVNNTLSVDDLHLANSSISLQPVNNKTSADTISFVYTLPHGDFAFTYSEKGYLQNSTVVNINTSSSTHNLNITGYGVILLIHNPYHTVGKLTILPDLSFIYSNSSVNTNLQSSVVAFGVNLSGISVSTTFTFKTSSIRSQTQNITNQQPFAIQYVNISHTEPFSYLFDKRYNGTTLRPIYELYNGSVTFASAGGFLMNVSVLSYNGKEFVPFNMTGGTIGYLTINGTLNTIFGIIGSNESGATVNAVKVMPGITYSLKIKLGSYQDDLSNAGLYKIYFGVTDYSFKNHGGKE